jgi:hypothetical protein
MAAKTKPEVACPNCGSPLYQGHEGVSGDSIAVCRNNDDPPLGCLAAWDLKEISAGFVEPFGPWSVEAAPVVGPPDDAVDHAAEQDTTLVNADQLKEPAADTTATGGAPALPETVQP